MTGYRLRPKAVRDLESIGDFIAVENPARAASFIEEIDGFCATIAERPQAFQRRDDLAEGLRQAIHGRYLIFFTADDKGIVVERVLHGARRLDDLL